ncbi:MAG: hypothetical protein C0616_14070 [Desulfuromonas sp.]|nr:MAG: hypothetical protein C0616_14070 [Desulfuromonas sp.]
MNKLLCRMSKVFTHPHLMKPFVQNWVQSWPYSLGDGSRAFKPREIFLYVTHDCNAGCAMCDVGQQNLDSVFYRMLGQNDREALPHAAWECLIAELAEFGPKIYLNGVEPLLYPRLLDLVATIKRHGLSLQLVTNGILLERYAADLVRLGTDSVVVSLDGTEQVHDAIRGPGVYQRAMKGVRALLRCREELGRLTRVSTNYCISNLNHAGLGEFAEEMLHRERIDFVNFTHLNYVTESASAAHNRTFADMGRATPVSVAGVSPDRVDVETLYDQIRRLRDQFTDDQIGYSAPLFSSNALRTYYHEPDRVVARSRCLTPWTSATVSAHGDVIIRSRCFEYVAGNVAMQPFLEIWNGEPYRRLRRRLRETGLSPVCLRCCGSLA